MNLLREGNPVEGTFLIRFLIAIIKVRMAGYKEGQIVSFLKLHRYWLLIESSPHDIILGKIRTFHFPTDSLENLLGFMSSALPLASKSFLLTLYPAVDQYVQCCCNILRKLEH